MLAKDSVAVDKKLIWTKTSMKAILKVVFFTFVQSSLVIIQPSPPKKSVRYNNSGFVSSMIPRFPLSFQADTQKSVGSDLNIGKKKY